MKPTLTTLAVLLTVVSLAFTAGYCFALKTATDRASIVLQEKAVIDTIDLIYIVTGEKP